ncbi:MAG: DUF1499 domain-containing protein [Pseudomonadota bacterium]
MAFFHFVPVTAESGPGRPAAAEVGDYPKRGGFYTVRPAAEVDLGALEAQIAAEPRTRKLAEGVYASRSLIWGFPDITHVWSEDGNVHVSSHLVYGSSDLGVNRRRIEGWLAALN